VPGPQRTPSRYRVPRTGAAAAGGRAVLTRSGRRHRAAGSATRFLAIGERGAEQRQQRRPVGACRGHGSLDVSGLAQRDGPVVLSDRAPIAERGETQSLRAPQHRRELVTVRIAVSRRRSSQRRGSRHRRRAAGRFPQLAGRALHVAAHHEFLPPISPARPSSSSNARSFSLAMRSADPGLLRFR
jgi:hypothetical protein